MTWTKNSTKTLPATGSRTVTITTEGGVQYIDYHVIDTDGDGHRARFMVAAVLAAHPEIDGPTLTATIAAFRSFGDAQCGFTDN
jgi:hypothetical protein